MRFVLIAGHRKLSLAFDEALREDVVGLVGVEPLDQFDQREVLLQVEDAVGTWLWTRQSILGSGCGAAVEQTLERSWVQSPPRAGFFFFYFPFSPCNKFEECPKSSPSRSSCSTKDIEFVKLKFNLCCFGYLGVKWEERMPTRDSNHLWKPTVADLRLVTTINGEPNCRFKSTADAWSIRSMLSRLELRLPWIPSSPAGCIPIRSGKGYCV